VSTTARSVAPFVAELLAGQRRSGVALGHGHLKLGSYVVTVTPPGMPRMPNGIECNLDIPKGAIVSIGEGSLCVGRAECRGGRLWNPRPRPRVVLDASPAYSLDGAALLGKGTGLTPQGDDVMVGYIAGRALLGPPPSLALFSPHLHRTTSLSATLLLHAALGELPEPAHRLLEEGDPDELLSFGHSSGRAMLLGLALAYPRNLTPVMPPTHVIRLAEIADLPTTVARIFGHAEPHGTIDAAAASDRWVPA
jgi:hypothetical protein